MHQSQLCNYYIALGDAILRSSALHCSGKCIAHSHPSREIRVRNLQHSLRSLVMGRVICALDVRVSHFVCIWRERKGSTSGYQYRYSVHSDRTGGYKFTSISSFFFFRFLAQMKIYIGKRILFLLSKSIYEGRHVIGWKRMKYQKLAPTFNKWLCVHDDVNMINKGVKRLLKHEPNWYPNAIFLIMHK